MDASAVLSALQARYVCQLRRRVGAAKQSTLCSSKVSHRANKRFIYAPIPSQRRVASPAFSLGIFAALILGAVIQSGCTGVTSAKGNVVTSTNQATRGTGALSASPSALSFGNVWVGTAGNQSLTITNSGAASVTISLASASGAGFTVGGVALPATLNPGASATFTATFAPTAAGPASGAASFASSQLSSAFIVQMSGTGTAVQPSITAQPNSQSILAGQTATFSVIASGTAPLSYQWKKNGVAISGATLATYTTPLETTSDIGAQFTVIVSNSAGSVMSNAATLTVTTVPVTPSITTQPSSQTIFAGQTATFSVVANGTGPLSYQWLKNGVTISGATSSSYTTPSESIADNGALLSVVVSNSAGNVTSNSATLTVNTTTSIVTVTINSGQQHQIIEGFGGGLTSWAAPSGYVGCSPPVDTVPDQVKSQILDNLYVDLGLTSIPLGFGPGGAGDFPAITALLPAISGIMTRVEGNGDRVILNSAGTVGAQYRGTNGRLLSNGASLYASWATNGLVQLKTQYGLAVDRWDIQEEPDGTGNLLPAELDQLVATTGSQFQAAGLSTRIPIPRTSIVSAVPSYANPMLSDSLSRPFVPQLDYHEYDYDASVGQTPDISGRNTVRNLANQFGLTVAMRETSTDVKQNQSTFWNGTYDQAMVWANDILTDMTEADAGAWDLIDAFWSRTNTGVSSYIILDYSSCVFTSFEIPPHYWTLRQVTKFVRPGAVRVTASSDSTDVRIAAFVDIRHQQTVVVAINNNSTQEQITKFTGLPDAAVSVTQTTPVQNGAQLPATSVQGGQFTASLPARSVTTFVVSAVP